MGSVYLARQSEIGRLVALKVLQAYIHDAENSARFEREAIALSTLRHKNIATFYCYGLWQGNIPFIAMEYLSGVSLEKLLQQEGPLSYRRAVEIMIHLCHGTAHAHAHNVIHRDLKPANVLILQEAQNETIKIVDFGLAKPATESNEKNLAKLTKTGLLVGTVPYMSPEQCTGLPATEKSDVYSLGCILFELVVGQQPFVADSPVGILYKHINLPCPKLNDVATVPQKLSDLLGRVMSKDPALRPSAKELGDKLSAILADADEVGAPKAKAPAFIAGSFIGGSILVLVLIGVASFTPHISSANWQPSSTNKETRKEPMRLEKYSSGIQAISNTNMPSSELDSNQIGNLIEVGTLNIQQGKLAEAESLFKRCLSNEKADTQHKYHVIASLEHLAQIYRIQNSYAQEEAVGKRLFAMQKHWQQSFRLAALCEVQHNYAGANAFYKLALELTLKQPAAGNHKLHHYVFNRLVKHHGHGIEHDDQPSVPQLMMTPPEDKAPDLASFCSVAESMANCYRVQSNFAGAEQLLKKDLAIREKDLASDQEGLVSALMLLGEFYVAQNKYAAAEQVYNRVLTIRKRQSNSLKIVAVLPYIGDMKQHMHQYSEATSVFRQMLELQEKLLGADHPDVAATIWRLVELNRLQGTKVEWLEQKESTIRAKLLSEDHPDASALARLADICMTQQRYADAEPLYERLAVIKARSDDDDLPKVLSTLAIIYQTNGKLSKAELAIERVVAIREKSPGRFQEDLAKSLCDLANVYMAETKYEAAERLYARGLQLRKETPNQEQVAFNCRMLGVAYLRQCKYAQARVEFRQALAIRTEFPACDQLQEAIDFIWLAATDFNQGKYPDAMSSYQKALAILDEKAPNHPQRALVLYQLGRISSKQGKEETAVVFFKRASKADEHLAPPCVHLGHIYRRQRKYAVSVRFYERAIALIGDSPNVLLPETLFGLAESLANQGLYDKSRPLYKRALAIYEKNPSQIPESNHEMFLQTLKRKTEVLRLNNQ